MGEETKYRKALSFFRFWLVLEGEKPKPSDFLFSTLPHKLSTAVKHSCEKLMKAMNHLSLKSK